MQLGHLKSKIYCASVAFLFFSILQAAPIPLTSSSLFISSKKGYFQSPLGFSLHLADTNWVQISKPIQNPYIETIYRATDNPLMGAALTVRVDKLDKPIAPTQYAQKWLKDYPRFGFEIINSKKVRVGDEIGYLIDMINQDNSKQLRQILFVKKLNAVTLTCRDDASNFSKTIKSCNDIIKTFKW